ncbi:18065_t:CDS:2, partial [Gigaspora margarita]
EIRETKLEKKKDEIEPDYMKPEMHTQYPKKNENAPLTSTKPEILLQISARLIQFLLLNITQNMGSKIVNIDTTNQKETTMIMVINNEQAIFPSTTSSSTIEQESHDKLTKDASFSNQSN